MTEYITKEAAVNAIGSAKDIGSPNPITRYNAIYYAIEGVTAADVVEVVRCKNCEYGKEAKVNEKGFLVCPASGMEITDDDFCSYGERRE